MSATTARYSARAITVDSNGTHYGQTFAHNLALAIGPARWDGFILVTDGESTFEVVTAQLSRTH